MLAEPKLERRSAQPYVSIHAALTIQQMGEQIGGMFDEIADWVNKHGITPTGAAFIRYNVIDMENLMEIEVGYPVPQGVTGDARVQNGTIPIGRYLTAIYTGDFKNLMPATAEFLQWAEQHKIVWDVHGNTWGGRFEFYLTDDRDNPDPSTWQTELAFLTA